jgi:hypothetical protein
MTVADPDARAAPRCGPGARRPPGARAGRVPDRRTSGPPPRGPPRPGPGSRPRAGTVAIHSRFPGLSGEAGLQNARTGRYAFAQQRLSQHRQEANIRRYDFLSKRWKILYGGRRQGRESVSEYSSSRIDMRAAKALTSARPVDLEAPAEPLRGDVPRDRDCHSCCPAPKICRAVHGGLAACRLGGVIWALSLG